MLESSDTNPDAFTYPSLLKACTSLGLSLHQQINVNGLASDAYISSSILHTSILYAKFKNIGYARNVFDMMPQRNIVPWTTIIWCYSHAGDMRNAFVLYDTMQYEDIPPSPVTVLNVQKGFLRAAMLMFCMPALSKGVICCGRIEDVRKVFALLDKKDIVSWNSLITALSMVGNLAEVLNLFSRMRFNKLEPDQQTFGSLVSAVARQGSIEVGRVAHGQIMTSGFELVKRVGASLVSLYSRCRKLDGAFQIFEQAVDKDVVFWTNKISGLVQNDSADDALRVFQKMLHFLRQQMAVDILIQNSLVSLYAKCGLLDQSLTVFSKDG
ncbi:hypothetical protein C2S51_003321 [Perilla frutescens var. frutescens]|nr:hypothetical protein C2S51_003321 [Perilla frutescens var. frutescens]